MKLTQASLAKSIGTEQSTVSGWENDPARQPSRSMIPRIAKALSLDPAYLEFGSAELMSEKGEMAGVDGVDADCLAECLKMAMRSLAAPYGIQIPELRISDAARATVTSYQNFMRIRNPDR